MEGRRSMSYQPSKEEMDAAALAVERHLECYDTVMNVRAEAREAARLALIAAWDTLHPVVTTAEDLLDTRAGLALANGAFKEGMSAVFKAYAEAGETGVFTKPVSPYSAPLLRIIKGGDAL